MVINFFQIYWTLIVGEEWLILFRWSCRWVFVEGVGRIISKNALSKMVYDILKIKSFEKIIVGDFNLPEILWIDGYGSSKTWTTGFPFASCLSNNCLYQTVHEPTRIFSDQNPSILDLVIVSSPEILISNDYLPPPPPWKKQPCYNYIYN